MLPWQRFCIVRFRLVSRISGFRLVGVLVIASSLLLLGADRHGAQAGSQATKPQKCTSVPLRQSQRPWMTSSGAWNGPDLLLADSVRKSLLRYSNTGLALGAVTTPATDELQSFSPERVIGQNGHLVLELAGVQFATLDPAYRLVRQQNGQAVQDVRAKAVRESDGIQIDRSYNSIAAGSDLLAFADLKHPTGSWSRAIVRFPMDRPDLFLTLNDDVSEGTLEFALLGHPYMTALGDTAYILLMEPEIRIVRNAKGAADLKDLTYVTDQLFRNRRSPVLPTFDQREDFAAVMRVVEDSDMPTGIYGWEGSLYVVSRKPDRGGTKWSLSKIMVEPENDGDLGELVSTMTLPTRANHLTVVPGPDKWALVEKGPVKGFTTQRIDTLRFIPSSLVRAMSSASRGDLCR